MLNKLESDAKLLKVGFPKKNIVFVVTGLTIGGAEMMLLKLCSTIDRSRFSISVISMRDQGAFGPQFDALGVPVYSLMLNKPGSYIPSILKIRKLFAEIKVDLVQGWMYHGNLLACLFLLQVPVCWGIRQSFYGLGKEHLLTRFVILIGKYLSRFPKCIVYNSHTSARQHSEFGFSKAQSAFIPNGFDTEIMQPNRDSYSSIRKEFGLRDDVLIIGLIARFHPMKDHECFLNAAALLIRQFRNVRFLLVGSNVSEANAKLTKLIEHLGLDQHVLLLGERNDIPRITAALDIATSSSAWGEGFGNSIGEAMSCGVPCVVTDVGDSAWIVGETGRVVPPSDPNALATAWESLIVLGSEGRNALGAMARERVRNIFSLDSVAAQYENLYTSLIDKVKV